MNILSRIFKIMILFYIFMLNSSLYSAQTNITLTFGIMPDDLDYWTAMVNDSSFKKILPNVKIDFQMYNSTEEMIYSQKIRKAIGDLPDIFYIKPNHIVELRDACMVWGPNENLVKINKYMDIYEVNSAGKGLYYGLPMWAFSEWVYYKKSIFKELNLEIPKTWNELLSLVKIIKNTKKYIPIAMGAKDLWPVYPFNEFLPHLVSNDPYILSNLAKQDEPFGPGSAFFKAYQMTDELYSDDIMGDPLNTTYIESENLFINNKAVLIFLGQYFLSDYIKFGGDVNDLGVFTMPVVSNPNEQNRAIGIIDHFLVINKNCKYKEEVKKIFSLFFNPVNYKKYITEKSVSSTINGINAENLFTEAEKKQNFKLFMYIPGNENYTKLANETQFEVKSIGQMMLAGKSYKEILADFNIKWKQARKKFNIK
jgi:raffinose/stachyose/melibiose transport system substrate-binding protein